jgi:hypothetical protein
MGEKKKTGPGGCQSLKLCGFGEAQIFDLRLGMTGRALMIKWCVLQWCLLRKLAFAL